MTWRNEVIPLIRVLISDLDSPYTYTDRRLEQLAVVSAHIVNGEVPLNRTYTVSIAQRTISPDPTSVSDDAFINLIALKSACLCDWSTYRTEILRSGIKAKLGPATLETMNRLPGFTALISKGPCESYSELKMQWAFGGGNAAKVILSPFVSNEYDPANLGTGESMISRMFD